MKYLLNSLIIFSILSLALHDKSLCTLSCVKAYADYSETIQYVSPYLLPDDHPVRPKLDRIFSASRVLLNIETMKKAGFINPVPRKYTKLIVTKHPDIKGYIIKAYLDAQRYYKDKPEYYFWIKRASGAEAIREWIEEHYLNHVFKVPKKWIYALPAQPCPPNGYYPKNFILVEEDMNLDKKNEEKWKSNLVAEELLIQVYSILSDLGLSDCAKPDNIPFCKDGRIAFIDTQSHHQWPVRYEKLTRYLSADMKKFWKRLTNSTYVKETDE